MKGRDSKGAPSADLLVCFPTRAQLTLMPKPICSPARHSESAKRHHHKKSGGRGFSGPGLASPLLWAKNSKQMGPESSEPTSPKVTCAGQIKVRPTRSSAACRNWQSVMEEIERIHSHEKQRKSRPTWAETLGFKKEVMQFLTCLRSIKFDFRCFGSFPEQGISSDEDDDDEEEHQEDGVEIEEDSRTVFSKWFMMLQENQEDELSRKQREDEDEDDAVAVPPPNALLLMRCRSAPAESRVKQGEDGEQQMKKKKKRESLEMVMKYDTDFNSDVAEETWVVGGLGDPFARSRSWKR